MGKCILVVVRKDTILKSRRYPSHTNTKSSLATDGLPHAWTVVDLKLRTAESFHNTQRPDLEMCSRPGPDLNFPFIRSCMCTCSDLCQGARLDLESRPRLGLSPCF